ncbi:hypothetical protein NSPZN2_30263 [Nitrospira defluvii]|uniref:Uncharacterized protein n=1 Tax=Nitrospira defluvii TaxID=330214 RepID=A0ABM8RHE6_9BACT|nr:hypothetical protein NSPZN2_30263 [Nitrospira defluvii]
MLEDPGGPGLLRRIVGAFVAALLWQSHLNRPDEAGCVLHEWIPVKRPGWSIDPPAAT